MTIRRPTFRVRLDQNLLRPLSIVQNYYKLPARHRNNAVSMCIHLVAEMVAQKIIKDKEMNVEPMEETNVSEEPKAETEGGSDADTDGTGDVVPSTGNQEVVSHGAGGTDGEPGDSTASV